VEILSKQHEHRVSIVRSMLSGDLHAKSFTDRTELWGPALDAITSQGGLLFGLGHGSMGRIVGKAGEGLSPHNYFLFVLGNSGNFALFGLLAFHLALFQQGHKCPDRRQRAAIYGIASLWLLAHMVDNSLIGDPAMGAVFTCVVVAIAYARPNAPTARRVQRLAGRDPLAARPRQNLPISQCKIPPSRL
jgi:O-antigen ligase